MSLNFLIFFFYYFIILLSIIGYGYFLLSFEKKEKSFNFYNYDYGHIGITGIFFLILYSYFSNIFIAHTQIHNLFLILVGNIFFLYFSKKNLNKFNLSKNLFFLAIIFLIIFISLLIKKNHDDFPYYHFSYTYNLTQNSLDFGIGKINHGFRTPSSIFYLNSLFYLPLADYYLFNFSSAYVIGFSNLILLRKIFNLNLNWITYKKNLTSTNFLSLIIFIFINIFFYRLSEHGTDRSAQILIFILFIYFLKIFQNRLYTKEDFYFVYILVGLIISFKSFYFLYLIFGIPFFIYVYENEKSFYKFLKVVFLKRQFLYLLILIFFILLSNFTNTSCLLYPVSFTCFEEVSWSIPKKQVIEMNNWYELWSKAGANPNFRVENPSEYILGYNWVSNWINQYFFNKISDFIIGLSLLILIVYFLLTNISKKKKKFNISKFVYAIFFILIIILFEWFYNHPALRYGGYCIIALIIFIPYSFYLARFQIDFAKYFKIALYLVLVSIFIFDARNYFRVKKEIELYDYKPLSETFYTIDRDYFKINQIIQDSKNKKGLFSKTVF